MTQLKEKQLPLFKDAINIEKHKISLYEAPTGFGKSIVAIKIAIEIAKNKGKKVILCTTTNQLAFDYFHTITNKKANLEFEQDIDAEIILGKEQYFDVNNIKIDELKEYMDIQKLEEYIKNITTSSDYLFDSLFDALNVEEQYKLTIISLLKRRDTNNNLNLLDHDIIITNYHYLLSKVFYDRNIDFDNFVVIADEVHHLVDVAEQLLTSSFSLYQYRNLISSLINGISNNKIPKKNKKSFMRLELIKEKATTALDKLSNIKKIGSSTTVSNESGSYLLTSLKSAKLHSLKSSDFKLLKNLHTNNERNLKLVNDLRKEHIELGQILNSVEDISVVFSPSKGYPRYIVTQGEIRHKLNYLFYSKIHCLIGLSATIKANENDNPFIRYGVTGDTSEFWEIKYNKLAEFYKQNNELPNIFSSDKEVKGLATFIKNQRDYAKKGWLLKSRYNLLVGIIPNIFKDIDITLLQEDKKKIKYIKNGVIEFESSFKKEQLKINLVDSNIIAPQMNSSDDYALWIDTMAKIIYANHDNKNTLVLCSSFNDTKEIGKALKELEIKVKLHVANPFIPAKKLIDIFKKDGGILIGTQNYGTGLNLVGEYLEKEFITRLPFSVPTAKKWLDIKENDKKASRETFSYLYISDMILTFRQWIGRLIRSTKDNGELYILDSRINNNRYKKKLFWWLEKIGIINDKYIDTESLDNTTSVLTKKDELLSYINTIPEDNIKEFLLSQIENILETKTFLIADEDYKFKRLYRGYKNHIKDEILK